MDVAFGGKFATIEGPLQPQGSDYYFKELEGSYKQDLDKARALLKEAGFNSPSDLPTFEYTVVNLAVVGETAQIVQQQFLNFGLKLDFKTVDFATLSRNRTAGTYTIQPDGAGPAWPDPDYLRQLFHSTQGNDYATGAKYKNDRLDQLLVQGALTTNAEERKKIYLEAERIILDDAPIIWLFWRPQAESAAKYVKNYLVLPGLLSTFNVNRFEYVWLDK
jgi:peptide/nickel transport system substrate-binding protein